MWTVLRARRFILYIADEAVLGRADWCITWITRVVPDGMQDHRSLTAASAQHARLRESRAHAHIIWWLIMSCAWIKTMSYVG